MSTLYCPYKEAVEILMTESAISSEFEEIKTFLENADSPVTRKYQEKLFQSVIDRSHIDFDDIPNSRGKLTDYKGYNPMIEVLKTIKDLAESQKAQNVLNYVKIVEDAIDIIISLESVYRQGFDKNVDLVEMEYNTYVYACVEATTSLLYEFVEYTKRPDNPSFVIELKNNTMRANLFYFEQLKKFVDVNKKLGISYRNMLETAISKGSNNFIGTSTIIGVSAVSVAALSVIPITRSLIFNFYKLRGDLSKNLELQAKFLEMNKACVEANTELDVVKKKKVLNRQEAMRKDLLRLADVLRVKSAKATVEAKKEIATSNKSMSIDSIRDEISSSDLQLL